MFIKKKINSLRALAFASACLLLPLWGSAQFTVQSETDATTLAGEITGDGVQILNATLTGAENSAGTFQSSVPNFAIDQGVILSTGSIFNAEGPNNVESETTEFGEPGDELLNEVSGFNTFDAVVLEFDVIPRGDTLRFDFSFASEEYQEYVGTPFNDVFGFFISGPGITGQQNIALIPGTNTPVEINSVNNGNPSTGFPAQNPEFYQNNPLNLNAPIQYDGWTNDLFAQVEVTPCDTFHLKLAIADASDDEWDSAVMISRIESDNVELSTTTDGGTDYMIEGCNFGTLNFTRTVVEDSPLDIEFFIDGTATNGTDYPLIGDDPDPTVPKQITIPAGEATTSIEIDPLADGLEEGLEYITVYLGNPNCEGGILDSLQFFIRDSLELQITPPNPILCPGDSVTLTANTDGTSFEWDSDAAIDDPTLQEITVSPDTTTVYEVTTMLSECVATDTVEVQVNNLSLEFESEDVLCAGAGDGSIDATVTGGSQPYTYSWTGPDGFTSNLEDLEGLEPGLYILQVTDREECAVVDSVEIAELPEINLTVTAQEYPGGFNVSCPGASDGSASVFPGGGTPPYTYSWDDPSSQTTSTATGLGAGTYTVTVTDSNGCEETASITLEEPPALGFDIVEQTDVACFGGTTGSVIIEAFGGVPGYNFTWNTTPPQFGPELENVGAGTYEVTITDNNGCSFTGQVTIEEPDEALDVDVSTTGTACSGDSDGTATANVTGGTPPYSITWNTDPVQTGETATDLESGNYTVEVVDDLGCTTSQIFTISSPQPLEVEALSIQDVDCFGEATGSVTVQATGGTTPYSYTWDTDPPTTGNSLTGVVAGTYTVTVVDANDCETTLEVEIEEPEEALDLELVELQDPTCNGDSNGSIEVLASGGTAPYDYSWDTTPPQSGPLLEDLEAGTYNLTVEDANGCTIDAEYTLEEPDELNANITDVTDVLCFEDSTGSATVEVSGGTPPYEYLWDDPDAQTTATASGLPAGTYTVEITDSNDCTAELSVTIDQPDAPLEVELVNQQNVLCNGESNGSITVNATGGSGSYSYEWDDPNQQTGATATGLSAGTYTVTVFDNNGCDEPATLEVEITEPDELDADILPSPPLCAGDSSGSIAIDIFGGTEPYDVEWTLPGGGTTDVEDLEDIPAGTYSVDIIDANGCETGATITLTEPPAIDLDFDMTPSLCFGSATGEIDITVTGGFSPYSYSWTGPDGFTSSDQDLMNLEGGVYTVVVTDQAGCTLEQTITVTQPEDLEITLDSTSSYMGGWDVSCALSSDGAIYTSTEGGQEPYDFSWNTMGDPDFADTEDVTGLEAGEYELVVTDDNGCIQNLMVTLEAPDTLEATITGTEELPCSTTDEGSLSASAEGGTPGYTFSWSGPNGFTSMDADIDDLLPGVYTVEITDVNGCIDTGEFEITSPDSLEITINVPDFNGFEIQCAGGTSGVVNPVVSGGTAPFTYSWTGPDGFTSSDQNIEDLEPGTYCVEVTDANDCEQSACVEINEPNELSANLDALVYPNGENISCEGASDGEIETTVSGGVAPFDFLWSGPGVFTSQEEDLTDLGPGEYCLELTDANGCTFEECITLTEPDSILIDLEASIVGDFNIACNDSATASIDATVTGGAGNFTFAWTGPNSFSASSEDIADLEAGTYCLEVTDQNGCTEEACINITEPPAIEITLDVLEYEGGFNISCNGAADGAISATIDGGIEPYTFSWNGPDGFTSNSLSISELAPGEYCLDVTDDNGCMLTECVTLIEPDTLSTDPQFSDANCSQDGVTVNLNVEGGSEPYDILWSNDETGEFITLSEDGTYSVLITDANGCSLADTITVEGTDALEITLNSPVVGGGFNIACNGDSTGSIDMSIEGGLSPVSIEWTGPDGFTSADTNLTDLPAGEYCVTVTDAANCEVEQCINLTQPNPLSVSVVLLNSIDCNGESTGSLTYSINGGVPAYSIEWTGPDGFTSQDQVLENLDPGEYCIEVTDLNGCTVSDCDTLEVPDPITIDLTSPETNGYNVACNGESSGSIESVIAGGIPPYTYNWTGPNGFTSNEPSPGNLEAGEYCLTIIDSNDCEFEECITLTEPDAVEVDWVVLEYGDGFNVSCAGECDGAIDINNITSIGPYTIQWTGPDGYSSTDEDINNLCAGDYTLEVTDSLGCTYSFDTTLVSPEPIDLELTSPVFGGGFEVSCFGDSTGTIFPEVIGGSEPFTFSWSGPDGFTSNLDTLELLPAGEYTLTVEDASGCETTASITLNQPDFPLDIGTVLSQTPGGTNITCADGSDGFIDVVTTGGTQPYNFDWSGPNGFTAETEDISDLEAGTYELIIEDANSCVFTEVVELTDPEEPLQVDLEVTSTPLCFDSDEGSISATISGGIPSYEMEWSGPDGFTATGTEIDELTEGEYQYTVTDTNGCEETGSIEIEAPEPINSDVDQVQPVCSASNGTIILEVIGGTQPYEFEWNTGDDGNTLEDVPAGEYSVTITDANGCTAEVTTELDSLTPMEADASSMDVSCAGSDDGALELELVDAESPVDVTWVGPDGYMSDEQNPDSLAPGEYDFTVIDAFGCEAEGSATILEPDTLDVMAFSPLYDNGFNLSGYESGDGRIDAPQIEGGTPPFELMWTGPDNFSIAGGQPLNELQAGTYNLEVIDANGCIDSTSVTLTEPEDLDLPNGISPNGDGFNDYLEVRGIEAFPNNTLKVFNRWGSQVYEEANYSNSEPWFGTNEDGDELPESTYFVVVEIEGRGNLNGYLELRR